MQPWSILSIKLVVLKGKVNNLSGEQVSLGQFSWATYKCSHRTSLLRTGFATRVRVESQMAVQPTSKSSKQVQVFARYGVVVIFASLQRKERSETKGKRELKE
jgi:hypothetical protein